MTRKPSDVLSRMKVAATREKPVTTVMEEAAPVQDQTPSSVEESAKLVAPRTRKVRYTLDLDPVQHKNLKRFALEAEVDASEVMRTLLTLLQTDIQLRNAVLTALSKE